MTADLGPQARRVYKALFDDVVGGILPPGTKLPPQSTLAAEFGVALMTVRQALGRLQTEGLIVSRHGRGTFVGTGSPASVLMVEDDPRDLELLRLYVTGAGYPAIEALGPDEGLAALGRDRSIRFVLTDVCMPTPAHGIDFIRTIHGRWPDLWVVAVTGAPDELTELHGTPECPMLILAKPVQADRIQRLLRLLAPPPSGSDQVEHA